MNKKLILKIENAILLILVAVSLFVISLGKIGSVNAADNIITVHKNSAISVYVTGIGVELKNSTSFVDEYTYELGTEFTINSVNETKIFSNYVITDSNGTTNVNTRKYTGTKNSDFSINVEGTVPLSSDQGSYMGDRFLLEDDEDLIALQEIIKAGPTYPLSNILRDFYNQFIDASAITSSNYQTYYNKIINGYYLIANNISIFSSLTINSNVYNFTGIGTTNHPFEGVMCGNVSDVNSQVVSVINVSDLSDANLYSFGFFGNLSDNAVVRNLKFATSIGLKSDSLPGTDIYAGGVAGFAGSALFVDVDATANISVDLPSYDTNVYTGTFVGRANGLTIDSISDITNVRDHSSLTVNTQGNNYAGGIAGYANNMYIKELDINFSGLSIILRNVGSKKNAYGGVLFGYLNNNKEIILENIHVTSTENFRIETYSDLYDGTNMTGAYSGGIAGYFKTNADAYLGNITFVNESEDPAVISSNTINASSTSNCYSGGLFGYITDSSASYVKANDDFKNRIIEKDVDGKKAYSYNPIFTGDFDIKSVQNGLGDHLTGNNNSVIYTYSDIAYGKCVSGGLVGRGLINLNGSDTVSSDIVLTKEGKFNVSATQTRIAKHENFVAGSNRYLLSDYEHCISSIMFGLISNLYTEYTFENINVYAENAISTAEREIGSQANGHILNGGFIAFANGQDFDNINLYYNDCEVNLYSLSYEAHSRDSADRINNDNAHAGGFVGFFNNGNGNTNSSNNPNVDTSESHTLNNVTIQGINWDYKHQEEGTKLKVYSIQNTPAGAGDCAAENYIGGVIGKLYRNNVTNVTFIGSETNEDYIRMAGHEDPDSAFCGGIIGYVNGFRGSTTGNKIDILNCTIKNADVYGEATITQYNDPDIFIGGVVGAIFSDGTRVNNFNLSDLKTIKSNVKGLGNERVKVYTAGILAGAVWSGGNLNINNCYVSDSYIDCVAKQSSNTGILEARASGILGMVRGFTTNINNNAVIECLISSTQHVAGICMRYDRDTVNINNNYSNAILNGVTSTYGIYQNADADNYYHAQNAGVGDTGDGSNATDVSFEKQLVNTENDKVVDGVNTDQEYMKYVLEYGPKNNSGYKTNGGITTVTTHTYTYYKVITKEHYDSIKTEEEAINQYLEDEKLFKIANNSNIYLLYGTQDTTNSSIKDRYEVQISGTNYFLNAISRNTYNGLGRTERQNYTQFRYNNTNYYYHNDNDKTYNTQTLLNNYKNDNPDVIIGNKSDYKVDPDNNNFYLTVNPDASINKTDYDALDAAEKQNYREVVTTTTNTVTIDNSISFIGEDENVYVDKLHLWVNFRGLGTTPGYEFDPELSREELHALGWFDFGNVIVYNKDEGVIENPKQINNDKVTYVIDDAEYAYVSSSNSFTNQNYPFDTVNKNGYEVIDNNNYTVKVHDTIPTWKLTFSIDNSVSLIEEFYEIVDGQEKIIDTTSGTVKTYGSYTISYTIKNSNKIYTLTFTPNVEIDTDVKVIIKFRLGNSKTLDPKTYTLDIYKNNYVLVGVKYADYTPALNNYDYEALVDPSTGEKVFLEGQYRLDIAYQLPLGSIIKFVPIFKRSNDLTAKLYEDERFLKLVTFSSTHANTTVKTSGELTVPDTGGNKVTIRMSYDGVNVDFTYVSSTEYQVTYSVVGMTPEAIPYASKGTDYEFICYVNNGYSGFPNLISIKVNNTTYSYTRNGTSNLSSVVKYIKDANGNSIDLSTYNWDMNNDYYKIVIDSEKINGNINITVEFPLVYTIRFDLQNSVTGDSVRTFKVEDGQDFRDFFYGARDNALKEWVEAENIFGFAFTGFFLVAESNTHSSYGIEYESILEMENFAIHTSFTFYARWSFLIELVEAPGTTITPSFKDTFMTEITDPSLVNRVIKVPLNNKEGYVFTVEKDPTFIGEAEVQAFIITKVGDKQVVTEITIEKYHENMYLYHIPSEVITGYLMIVTSISNSGFIVGQNTASVTEEILPEDGVFTYKYVVNHKNDETDQSYLYDSGKEGDNKDANLLTYKNFVLYFYEQTYDTNKLKTDKTNYYLPAGTSIEVYYQKYNNNVIADRIVASYEVQTDNTIHYISIDEFKTIDYQDSTPFKHENFETFLGNYDSVSEVYYFVITPPNGYRNIDKEIKNIIIEGGYENEYHYEAILSLEDYANVESALQNAGKPLTDLNKFKYNTKTTKYIDITESQYAALPVAYQELFEYSPFVKGIRNGDTFANIPLENEQEADFIKYETSCQVKVYSITPSRITTNENNGTSYKFTDDKTYDVYYLEYENGGNMVLVDGKLSLSPTTQYDSIISSTLPFNLVSISFTAGYNIGKIEVYGIKNGAETLLKTVEVDKIEYQEYEVSFVETTTVRYDKFKLKVSASDGVIRMSSLSVVSLTNGMTYSMDEFTTNDIKDNKLYFENDIVNDQRHDGKTFMLAVQLTDGSGNVVEIPDGLAIKVHGVEYSAFIDHNYKGRVTAFFNMTEIINKLGGTSFDYIIVGNGSYKCIVQLIETTNPQKPAMSEVRK